MTPKVKAIAILLVLGGVIASACGGGNTIILATTTSTYDSGLVDALIPVFEKESGYKVKPIAVGSGQAMEMGERGDADVLLVHSPEAEEEFVAAGFGINRQLVMYNDFVIVGPPSDPAGLKGMGSASEALGRLAERAALFLSRGDNSGTHAREKQLWKSVGIDPVGNSWYQETGQGMGETLTVAEQKGAYTLSDRGTFLSMGDLGLVVVVEGDPILLNIYHVMQVNPERHGGVNAGGAEAFVAFMISEQAQTIIETFGLDRFEQALFVPAAGQDEASLTGSR